MAPKVVGCWLQFVFFSCPCTITHHLWGHTHKQTITLTHTHTTKFNIGVSIIGPKGGWMLGAVCSLLVHHFQPPLGSHTHINIHTHTHRDSCSTRAAAVLWCPCVVGTVRSETMQFVAWLRKVAKDLFAKQ